MKLVLKWRKLKKIKKNKLTILVYPLMLEQINSCCLFSQKGIFLFLFLLSEKCTTLPIEFCTTCLKKEKKMINKLLAWISVLIWMGVIFNFSAQKGEESSQLSQGVSKIVYNFVSRVPGIELKPSLFHSLLRQAAHFFVFFTLALLLINAFRISGVSFNRSALYTLLIAVIYAALDEYHQSFVPGRTATLKDVLTDSLGIIAAIGFYRALLFFFAFLR